MSAESTLAFWGVRFELAPADLKSCSTRSDPRQQKAQAIGLDQYWGNFGDGPERWLLFVGKRLAVIGAENASEIALPKAQLLSEIEETNAKLLKQGFHEEPAFHLVWQPDV